MSGARTEGVNSLPGARTGGNLDPHFDVDVRIGTVLAGVRAGAILFRRTSTFVGIRIFYIGIGVDRIPNLWHVIFLTDARDRICRKHDPRGNV